MKHHHSRLRAWTLAIILSCCVSAYGQTTPAAPLGSTPTPDQTLSSVPSILTAIEAAEQTNNEAAPLIQDVEPERRIRDAFLQVQPELKTFNDNAKKALESEQLSLDILQRMTQDTEKHLTTIESIRKSLRAKIDELSALLSEMESARDYWKKASNDLKKQKTDSSANLLKRIDSITRSNDETGQILEARLTDLISLQNLLDEKKQDLVSVLDLVNQARDVSRAQLLIHDAPVFFLGNSIDYTASSNFSSLLVLPTKEKIQGAIVRVFTQDGVWVALCLIFGLALHQLSRSKETRDAALCCQLPYTVSILTALFIFRTIHVHTWVAFARVSDLVSTTLLARVLWTLVPNQGAKLATGLVIYFILTLFTPLLPTGSRLEAAVALFGAVVGIIWTKRLIRTLVLGDSAVSVSTFVHRSITVARAASYLLITLQASIVLLLLLGYWRLGNYLHVALCETILTGLVIFILAHSGHNLVPLALNSGVMAPIKYLSLEREKKGAHIQYLIALFAVIVWLNVISINFGIRDDIYPAIYSFLSLGVTVGTTPVTVQGVLGAILLIALGMYLSSIIRGILQSDVFSRYEIDRGLKYAIDRSIHYTFIGFSVVFSLSMIGLDVRNIALIAGALSVGIGFGLQTIVNNFVGGVIILAERSVRIGDLISVGGVSGVVSHVSARATTIRVGDNAEVLMPNSKLITEQVTNWTLSNNRARIVVSITTTPDTDIARCLNTLADAVKSVPTILATPAPDILLKQFTEFGLLFQVGAWIEDVMQRGQVESALLEAIYNKFSAQNLRISFGARPINFPAP